MADDKFKPKETEEEALARREKEHARYAAYLLSPLGQLEKHLAHAITLIIEAKHLALAAGDGVHLELLDEAERAVKKVMRSMWEKHYFEGRD